MNLSEIVEVKAGWIAGRRSKSRRILSDLEAERLWLESPERRECARLAEVAVSKHAARYKAGRKSA